jgi:hypothetical protein
MLRFDLPPSHGLPSRPFGLARGFGFSLLILLPGALPAQVVQGRVLDMDTDQPVSSAQVELLEGEDGERTVTAVATDEAGRFRLQAPGTGTYRIRAGHIGYRGVTTTPVDLGAGAEALEVELFLGVEAIPLAPMLIVSDRLARMDLRLYNRGFYERRRGWGREGMGFGHFLGRDEIERRNPVQVVDLLRDVPGVRIVPRGGRLAGEITMRSVTSISGLGCSPLIFLDGVPAASGSPDVVIPGVNPGAHIDDLVSVAELAGVEVYPGLTAPAEFLRGNNCGVIVLWTGAGDRDRTTGPGAFEAFGEAGGPLALELRGGGSIGSFGPTGAGLHGAPGYTVGLVLDWRILSRLAAYTGVNHGSLACDTGLCRDVEASFRTTGWGLGLRGHLDVTGRPWIRLGVGWQRLRTEWPGEGGEQRQRSESGLGLEAGAGAYIPIMRSLSLTPGVTVVRWSVPGVDRGPFPSAWQAPDDRLLQIGLTVGLRLGF